MLADHSMLYSAPLPLCWQLLCTINRNVYRLNSGQTPVAPVPHPMLLPSLTYLIMFQSLFKRNNTIILYILPWHVYIRLGIYHQYDKKWFKSFFFSIVTSSAEYTNSTSSYLYFCNATECECSVSAVYSPRIINLSQFNSLISIAQSVSQVQCLWSSKLHWCFVKCR